jgi:hypothetical protein
METKTINKLKVVLAYIHGYQELMEQGKDKKGKFYKVNYQKEN